LNLNSPLFINPVFYIRYYPRNDREALTSLQVNHVESICNYLSHESVRARATEKGKNDNKNKYGGWGWGEGSGAKNITQ
jgi:hypothetical protein